MYVCNCKLCFEPTLSLTTQTINFEQFEHFCQLLNALDDFAISMTIFTMAGQPITKEEFRRASLVCTGKPLDAAVTDIIFCIFDTNGKRVQGPGEPNRVFISGLFV